MELKFNRQAILPVLSNIIGIVSSRPKNEIMTHLYCKVENYSLFMAALNDSMQMSATIEIDADTNGEFTLPAKKFLDLCRSWIGETVTLTLNDGQILAKCGRNRTNLATLDAKAFPFMPFESTKETTIELPAKDLLNAINATDFSMARNDARYFLNGLRMEFNAENQSLICVATDGHRLAFNETKLAESNLVTINMIMPCDTVVKVKSLLKNEKDNVTMAVSNGSNAIKIVFNDVEMISKLIDGRFPDYRRVMPRTTSSKYTVNSEYLKGLFQRISLMSDEKFRSARLTFNADGLTVSLRNMISENAEEEMDIVACEGNAIEIGINMQYGLDVLVQTQSENICFNFVDANSAMLIKPETEDEKSSSMYIIMPVRL